MGLHVRWCVAYVDGWRQVVADHSVCGTEVQGAKARGPFRVVSVSRPGAVRLETEDGEPVQNSWNIEHLRKYHLCQFYP